MSAMVKHSVILNQKTRPSAQLGVSYGVNGPESIGEIVEAYRMPLDVWEEMNRPETITVTVEIGDTLND